MRTGLSIGEFAQLTHLSVRTLRRYHETGLLEPAVVDPFTGYRYYSAEQIPPAQVIRRLRDLDVPLAEVKAILATGDPQRRAELITGHLLRLEGELDRTKAAVMSLRQLLHPGTADLHVELRSLPAQLRGAAPHSMRGSFGPMKDAGPQLSWGVMVVRSGRCLIDPIILRRTGRISR
jgi:DNA-binding transcriptional MerR regulator